MANRAARAAIAAETVEILRRGEYVSPSGRTAPPARRRREPAGGVLDRPRDRSGGSRIETDASPRRRARGGTSSSGPPAIAMGRPHKGLVSPGAVAILTAVTEALDITIHAVVRDLRA